MMESLLLVTLKSDFNIDQMDVEGLIYLIANYSLITKIMDIGACQSYFSLIKSPKVDWQSNLPISHHLRPYLIYPIYI